MNVRKVLKCHIEPVLLYGCESLNDVNIVECHVSLDRDLEINWHPSNVRQTAFCSDTPVG